MVGMTSQDFVTSIERYYGAYATQFKKDMVAQYVENIPPAERSVLLRILVESVSDQYKSVPDIAAIIKVRMDNAEEIARKSGGVWRDFLSGRCYVGSTYLGYYDEGTFIPNTMMQNRDKQDGIIFQPANPDEYAKWLQERGKLPGQDPRKEIA